MKPLLVVVSLVLVFLLVLIVVLVSRSKKTSEAWWRAGWGRPWRAGWRYPGRWRWVGNYWYPQDFQGTCLSGCFSRRNCDTKCLDKDSGACSECLKSCYESCN